MTEEPEQRPKIVIDDDWKERVQAEKEALRGKEGRDGVAPPEPTSASDKPLGGPEVGHDSLPPASFALMVSTFATQALLALGQMADPAAQEQPPVNLALGKHYIDLLSVLDEKTKGNLSSEEAAMLENVLHELRMLFVSLGS
jgi:hypothetical protein